MTTPLNALFVNEGALKNGPLGIARVQAGLRVALAGADAIRPRFLSLPGLRGPADLAVRSVPGLEAFDLDAQVVRWHAVQAARTRRMVRADLRRHPADVIHVTSHSIALGLIDEMARTPTMLGVDVPVWPFRQTELFRPLQRHSRLMVGPSLALERRAFERASVVLAYTEWARTAVLREAPGANCVVHHPGLDLEAFRPEARAHGVPRLLFVGGRFDAKGGNDLLAAVEGLVPETAVLDVVTPDPVPDRPGVTVHRLDAGDPHLTALFRAADIVCVPSHADSSPWTLLEGMASGAALVATAVGGIGDLMGPGRVGVLVPPRDVPGLAEAIRSLLADPTRREAMGAAGRARCEAHYDVRAQTSSMVDLMLEHRTAAGRSRER